MDLITALAIGAIVLLIYHYVTKQYQYFLTKPVPCLKPTFLLGSSAPMIFRSYDPLTIVRKFYNSFPDAKIMGFYDLMKPVYLIRDPEVVKKLAVKDFDFFPDHSQTLAPPGSGDDEQGGAGSEGVDSFFGNSLFALRGQKWRDMRATLSPAFTGSKMRHMFTLVSDCGKSVAEYFLSQARSGQRLELEMKDIFSRFGNDVIATVAFGIEVHSNRERENEFYVKGKQLLNFFTVKAVFKFILIRAMPGLMKKLKVDLFDGKLMEYFRSIIVDNMRQREAQGIKRDDMIHMLMEVRRNALKHQVDEKDTKDAGFATVEESSIGKSSHSRVWSENELIAQCFLFFFAGFDTVSSAMTFLSYELAINPDIQDRLYREVCEVDESLNGQPLSYEILQGMEYMDMVVSETLRKWPPFLVADRLCAKDYHYDDGAGTKFTIEKGCTLWLPSIGIQRDPQYYPDPDKFDPERFNEKNRSNIRAGAYLPFGIGPRNCIGSRLALMEAKSVTFYLLKNFRFEPTEKTEIPIKLAKDAFALQGQNGVWLELKPRQL